ncbi:MAG: glycosyl transferase, partial [Marinilabiliales bacterium]
KKKWLHVFLSAAFIGLGIMTKGPVALLIFALTLFAWLVFSRKWKTVFNLRFIGIYIGTVALIGGFWFILQILSGKAYLIMEFIEYQIRLFTKKDAGHGGFLFYHFVILFIGMFPASIFALSSFRKFKDDTESQSKFRHWMMISFWVVLILFTIVKTKIIHYSSFCYFPLSFLAVYSIYQFNEKKVKFRNWQKTVLIFMGTVLGLAVIGMNYFMANIQSFIEKGWIKDKFAEANFQADVHWSGFEFLIGVFLIFTVIFSIWYFRRNIIKLSVSLFTGTMLFTAVWLIVVTPKIEGYTQNAAIEFFESHKGEDVIMGVWGYKSYAHHFYFQMPVPDENYPFEEENLYQPWPKTTYISTKITKMEEFETQFPEFQLLYTKNGFAFYKKAAE